MISAVVPPGSRAPLLLPAQRAADGVDTMITLVGRERRYTFCIRPTGHVMALYGADNTRDYRCVGRLDARASFRLWLKHPASAAFAWFSRHPESPDVTVYLSRPCRRCGRPLTTPESVLEGIGPVCRTRES